MSMMYLLNIQNQLLLKLSRSQKINIQPIAKKYGGGGHKCAAGARLVDQKDFSLAMQVVKDLDELAKENENA